MRHRHPLTLTAKKLVASETIDGISGLRMDASRRLTPDCRSCTRNQAISGL